LKTRLPTELSALLHGLFAPAKRLALQWRAARCLHGGLPRLFLPVRSRGGDGPKTASIVTIRKRGGRLAAIEADVSWLAGRSGFSTAWRRLGAFVNLLSHPDVVDGEWRADLGDSVHEPGPILGFCSNLRDTLLVPDRGFQASGGYARHRRQALAAPAFGDRDDAIVWRGSPTGFGLLANATMQPHDADLRQRVRMCLLLAQADGHLRVDARIVPGRGLPADVAAAYYQSGIAGEPLPEGSWLGRQFAIDIDGNSNAFTNLFIRLLYGCCVIKVASPLGYRQWYYERLEPWRHYVPVAADLSDLVERIEWCRGHAEKCRAIAHAGQSLALAMTPAEENRRTVALIRNRPWTSPG
jgi:hypothetical protein